MFGWMTNRTRGTKRVGSDALANLAPYRGHSQTQLRAAAGGARRLQCSPGVIADKLTDDREWFLERGEVQFQTKTGFVLSMRAGSPQARFPMPNSAQLVSIYAAEPTVFLSVAPVPDLDPEKPTLPKPDRPALSEREAEALQKLHAYFSNAQCELPSLPDLAWKINRAIGDPSNANDDVARLIQLDPSLTARLISIVNSAAFGGTKKIRSIQQATTRLGRDKVRNLVYSCLLRSIFRINSSTLTRRMESIWSLSANVAALCYVLGRKTPGIDPEQALLAGLIHDIGSVAVIGALRHFPALVARPEVLDYAIASQRTEVGMLTLKQWNLHEQFADVVRDADNWWRMGSAIPENPDVVLVARLHALIGSTQHAQLPPIDSVPAFSKIAQGGLSPKDSLAMLDEAENEVREVRALLGGIPGSKR